MIEQILFFVHAGFLLFFGVFLSAAFSGIKANRKTLPIFIGFCIISGALQIVLYIFFGEDFVWKVYPLISHFPLFLLLQLIFYKRIPTVIVSICTAYLCCQPAKWAGLMSGHVFNDFSAEMLVKILILLFSFVFLFFRLSDDIAEIFAKDSKSVLIFGITPITYYIFDYFSSVYTDISILQNQTTTEFLAFFLCIIFLIFCLIYHKEYEQKSDAQRKEQIIRITVDQQKKELDAVKRSAGAIRIIRHDMKHFLANLSACIDDDNKVAAKKMISSYVENIDATVVRNYCENTTLNYIFSNFAERCREEQIDFICNAEISNIVCDETMLSTIISNALDNAINAQKALPPEQKTIRIMIKKHNEKLLLSVKNPFAKAPVFVNGVPVSNQSGHGFGTQSIVYLTERMGGNYRFEVENNEFVLMVVI